MEPTRISHKKNKLIKKTKNNKLVGSSSKRNEIKIPKIVATDDESWNIALKANVDRLNLEEAIKSTNHMIKVLIQNSTT